MDTGTVQGEAQYKVAVSKWKPSYTISKIATSKIQQCNSK